MGHDRRPMFSKEGLQARNQQAAKDALRRRQKAKKARIVKRHVRYKEKQKLLKQLERSAAAEPIVAAELPGIHESDQEVIPSKVQKDTASEDEKREQIAEEKQHEKSIEQKDNKAGELKEKAENDDKQVEKRKKYQPFTKQMKEFEQSKKEREAQEEERQKRISDREEMLARSKKQRTRKSKQYRKVTTKGQPLLKHRLDAMLAKIQKQ